MLQALLEICREDYRKTIPKGKTPGKSTIFLWKSIGNRESVGGSDSNPSIEHTHVPPFRHLRRVQMLADCSHLIFEVYVRAV